jgi:DNA polymerase-1
MEYKYKVVDSLGFLEKLVKNLRLHNSLYALDLETSGVDPWRESIVGAGICWSEKGAVYVPIAHAYDQPFEGREALELLRPLLIEHQFLAYNALFEVEFLEHDAKISPAKMPIDVMLLAYASGRFESMRLDFVASKLCSDVGVLDYGTFMASVGLSKMKDSIAKAPVKETGIYCGKDALSTFLVNKKLQKEVGESKIYKMERKLLPFVKKMRATGVVLDTVYLEEERERLSQELEHLKKVIIAEVSAAAGTAMDFNIKSSKQLGHVMFDVLRLRAEKITEGGARSTDKNVMSKLKWKNDIVAKIAIWKEIETIVSKYYTKLEAYKQIDGRIHASYNQAGAPTGRYSCSDPNLQNIPDLKSWIVGEGSKKHEITTNVRRAICVPDTHWLLAYDYSQIEARIAAGVTKEPALLNAFAEGIDFHTKTASLVFGIPVKNVTKEQRFVGKKLNFALAYGMGPKLLYGVLLKDMKVTYEQAKSFRERYLDAYPVMFHEASMISKNARRTASVNTIWGRRIPIPKFYSQDEKDQQDAERQAYNGVIQGSAADLLKISQSRSDTYLQSYAEQDVAICLTTHDENAFAVRKNIDIVKFINDILELMRVEKKGFPPFFASVEIGQNWGDMVEIKPNESIEDFMNRFLSGKNEEVAAQVEKSRVFILEIPDNVKRTPEQFAELREFINRRSGDNTIIFKIGDKERLLSDGTGVTLRDREQVALIFGGSFYERLGEEVLEAL